MGSSAFKQIDVTRAVKGAIAAGMIIREVVASRDGVRIISSDAHGTAPTAANTWDEVFDDGPQK